MILVDANIPLYAENSECPQNEKARAWWDARLSGDVPVCLCWTVINAFIRISTNVRVFTSPLTMEEAVSRVQSWVDQPCVRLVQPTERHWTVFQDLLIESQASGNLVTDAHLAALAITHGCELMSSDADFSRFAKLKWSNPLKSS